MIIAIAACYSESEGCGVVVDRFWDGGDGQRRDDFCESGSHCIGSAFSPSNGSERPVFESSEPGDCMVVTQTFGRSGR